MCIRDSYLESDNQLRSYFSDHEEQNGFMKTTFEAIFIDQFTAADVFLEYNETSARYLAIFKLNTTDISPLFSINCERFIETVSSQVQCKLNCFIGIPSHIDAFHRNMKELRTMIADSLDCNGKVLLQSYYLPTVGSYLPCDIETLEIYLQTEQYSAFGDYCKKYLHRLSNCGNLHAVSLLSLIHI